uniref:NAD(P)H-quinone oxidoreductase subunit 5, chloroplastic n=1 Tax=Chaetosphaeridium globosum TaxID=96477 RepID=NU5C_CHAGL|nr:NADH dehydrogenase subunit 5 [Chaetosphaeridium globosum]Q8M9U5.1 RecName: Full=NAD(P)H-quinone oxidoreductase subunit 5, chloroplastic; AltName: Full=NAD(P)H dehydrogenase subunit 5; AltName: Full=NADH-plastoquinone oxidoreductase subunit 5 [Chaetosphaeridium globosum]AAM96519.1 subunit 5 of NADH-plastoquinone oxidoreductase [Chaetosphaeridium globosum]
MNLNYQYAGLIPILPVFPSIFIGIGLMSFRKSFRNLRKFVGSMSIAFMFLTLILSLLFFNDQLSESYSYRFLFPWLSTKNLTLDIGYLIDPLTSIMLVLVTSVAVTVMIYSDGYMLHDQGYIRFFAYLSLFTASMLGLIVSPNLIQVYVFWELIGMCSYLLVGFWSTRPTAASACQKAFITNRVGDFGLLLGILGFYWLTGSFQFDIIQDRLNELLLTNNLNFTLFIISSVLLFLGPIAKSAQFPLHIWLPDAMEGPTPISALIHAATMVAAGIFLVARLLPIFQLSPLLMILIAFTGAITALLGACLAVAQTDLKRGLAYSTMSQLGYMMLGLGIGGYQAAIFHLITHAYSKALLFLGSGSVIHSMEPVVGYDPNKSQNIDYMGGLRKYMPITGVTFLIGTLSLCGIPPFACFWSKDEIIADAFFHLPLLGFIAWLTAGLTGFYMFRLYLLTFEGEFRAHKNLKSSSLEYPHESSFSMTLPLILLMFPTIFIGFLGLPYNLGFIQSQILSTWLVGPSIDLNSSSNWIDFFKTSATSVGIAFLGICFSFLLYSPKNASNRDFNQISNPVPKGFLSSYVKSFYNWSLNRAYIDKFYELTWIKWCGIFAQFTSYLDRWFFDGFVNGVGLLTLISGEALRYGENGKVSSYLFVILFSFILLILLGNFNSVFYF